MKNFKKRNLWVGFLSLCVMFLSCEKDSIDRNYEIEQRFDSNENYFEGPLPEATVPIIDYGNLGNDLSKTSHEEITGSSLTPSFTATLRPEESHTETLTATINGGPSVGDVMFVMDLTGSMGGELNNAKVNSINIMNAIRSLIPNTNFGVSSHMDYVGSYNYCGYYATYGSSIDYPYSLDAALTSDLSFVGSALNGLSLGNGSDFAENYSRPLWELTNDPATGWRSGSKKVAIVWLDAIPHDCNVYELLGGNQSTGPDLGRDGVAGTEDDIVFIKALEQLRANNISLITLFSGINSTHFNLWSQASKLTGGQAYQINTNGTIPGDEDIAAYLAGLIEEDLNNIEELTIEVCDPAYESWLTVVSPFSYSNITLDSPFVDDYDVTITAPAGTAPGVYEFELCLIGDGAEYARSKVIITVPETNIEVAVDIHPGSCPNPLETKRNGVISVSISGTENFDVNDIDASSITLEGVSPLRWAIEDVSTPYVMENTVNLNAYDCHTLKKDGYYDLSLKFDVREILSVLGDVKPGEVINLTLTGELNDGTTFSGGDIIIISYSKK